jgi:hypothetical protein
MYRFAIASAWKAEIVHDTIAHGGHSQNLLAPTLSAIQCYCQMLDLVGESDVHVTRVQGNTSGLQAVGLGSLEGKLPEGALIVSNDSSEPVMTIVFKWTIAVQGNAARTQWLYVDGYYLPQPQPVLSPGIHRTCNSARHARGRGLWGASPESNDVSVAVSEFAFRSVGN